MLISVHSEPTVSSGHVFKKPLKKQSLSSLAPRQVRHTGGMPFPQTALDGNGAVPTGSFVSDDPLLPKARDKDRESDMFLCCKMQGDEGYNNGECLLNRE